MTRFDTESGTLALGTNSFATKSRQRRQRTSAADLEAPCEVSEYTVEGPNDLFCIRSAAPSTTSGDRNLEFEFEFRVALH